MSDLPARLLIFITIIAWGISGSFQKLALQKSSPASVQLVGAATVFLIISIYYFALSYYDRTIIWHNSGTAWSIIGAVASTIGAISFVLLLKERDVSSIIGYIACYPLVTFIIAILFMGEAFTIMRLSGIMLILMGIMLLGR